MKTIITGLIATLLLTTAVYAQDTIDSAEVRPDVTIWAIDTLKILAFTETAEVTYRKGYLDGSDFVSVGEEITIPFINVEDDLDTPEDEADPAFTQFINYIQTRIVAGDGLKQAITKAVKIKLQIN